MIVSWLVAPVEQTVLQVPRALVASALAAILDLCLLVILVEQLGLHPLVAATLSYLAGGLVQYYLCAVWVFPAAPDKAATGFAAFTILSLVGLGITWLTIATFNGLLHTNYALAKILALGLAFAWNFLSRKYLLFKPAA